MSANASMAAAPAQCMKALATANRVRLARAELKRRVAAGSVTAAEIIRDCPWEARSMTVHDLLLSQRRWGEMRVSRFLAALPMAETKTIGSMTDRQRRTLAALLTARPAQRDLHAPLSLTR